VAVEIIQVDYMALQNIVRMFEQEHKKVRQVVDHLSETHERLRHGGWLGENATTHDRVMQNEVFPAFQRLVQALDHASSTTLTIISLLQQADEESGNILIGHMGDTQWTGGQELIIAGSPGFKFLGDLIGASTVPEQILTYLGIVGTAGTATPAFVEQDIAMTGLSAFFKYLEKYEEEPDLMRGGSIALYDAIAGYVMEESPPLAIGQWLNSVHQVVGTIDAATTAANAYLSNIPPEMRDDVLATAKHYYDTVSSTDVMNFRYDLARLSYDIQHDPDRFATDVAHLGDTTFEFFRGVINYPEAFIENQVADSMVNLVDSVNAAPLPESFKAAVSSTASDFTEWMAQSNFFDTVYNFLGGNGQ
jgi:WXG100 family type VII secretion target